MKASKKFFKIIPLLLFVFSCNTPSENNKLIIGNWSGAEWLVNGKPSQENDPTKTAFTFNDKAEYTFNDGEGTQKGTYKIENDMLFTTATNEHEIMVKIVKLTKDSLVFDMNRGGQPEKLTLLKK